MKLKDPSSSPSLALASYPILTKLIHLSLSQFLSAKWVKYLLPFLLLGLLREDVENPSQMISSVRSTDFQGLSLSKPDHPLQTQMTMILTPPSYLILPELLPVHECLGAFIQKLCSFSRGSFPCHLHLSRSCPSGKAHSSMTSLPPSLHPHVPRTCCIFEIYVVLGMSPSLYSKLLSWIQMANPNLTPYSGTD